MKFEFFEDGTMKFVDTAKGIEEAGTWEQTGRYEFRYDVEQFSVVPDGPFKEAAVTLSIQDGNLTFALGFLAISMKKTADGVVTEVKQPDIGELEPSEADLAMKEIVGTWEVYKTIASIGEDFGLHTRDEVEADNKRRLDAGEIDEDEAAEALEAFGIAVEFTDDHQVKTWNKLPAGVSDEEIKEALEAGEIAEIRDGMFLSGESKEWKAVGGKYYYNTEEERMLFDEPQSPWDELIIDEEGNLPMGSGFLVLRRKK